MKIYILDNSELAQYEALNKGYRSDVLVEYNDNFYKVNIYDLVRFQQDALSEIEKYNYFSIDANIVIVKEVNEKHIQYTISKLCKERYFDNVKSISTTIDKLTKENQHLGIIDIE